MDAAYPIEVQKLPDANATAGMLEKAEPEMNRIAELDGVRGFAALLVVYMHLFLTWVPAPNAGLFWLRTMSGMAWTGVVLFFVLSGFLIGGNLLRHRESRNYFRVFYTRRAFRILPLYYSLLAAYLLIHAALQSHLPPAFASGEFPFWCYLTLVQNFFMAFTGSWGIAALAVTWSVAIEEQFYLFLPTLIRFVQLKWILPTLGLLALSGPFFRHFVNNTQFLLPGSSESLFGGVILARAYQAHPSFFTDRRWLWTGAGLFFVCGCGMALMTARHGFGELNSSIIAIFWCTFLWLVLAARQTGWTAIFRNRWLREIGKISYGVYLFHGLVYYLFFWAWTHRAPDPAFGWYGAGLAVTSFALVLILASLSFHLFEKRLIRLGQRHRYAK